jgi:hypothetical protein
VNKEEKAFDDLDLTVGRAIDDAVAAIAAGDIDHALEALDRALKASESNPIFSKRASSEFYRLEALALLCEQALEADDEPTGDVRSLIARARALGQLTIH